ncbi:MAG TPA: DUF5668 domain-containing protein [Bryobacteraceae bacterium]|nr:DUF5668 domain-containing protein [Bryobacteraceae bacterium]
MNPYTNPNPAGTGVPFGAPDPSYSGGYNPGAGYNPNAGYNPYAQPPTAPIAPPYRTSPALAFLLGWIPGVGAIYNGQYLKGLAHAVIFGVLVSLISNEHGSHGAPFLGIMIAAFVFYMPFEAYHTAKKQRMGVPTDEWSSFFSRRPSSGRLPVGPLILILLGVLFLLDSLGVMSFNDVGRFWPVLLIVIGAFKLYGRVSRPVYQHPMAPPPQAPPPPQPPADVHDVMGFRREQ